MNIDTHIRNALAEDLGESGDITSDAIFNNEEASYSLISKSSGVLCGIDIFKRVFEIVDNDLKVTIEYKDGDNIQEKDKVAFVHGSIRSILKAERTALNYLSHLSAIATKTNAFVKAAGSVIILDTRKTIPGLRGLQKYAVKTGGGNNHRIGLYDMIMIKDNHIDGCGSITKAVKRVRELWGTRFKIEVETRTLDEVQEAVDCSVDRIMLDNMINPLLQEAVNLIGKKAEIEASGNMTIKRLEELRDVGITHISFGELTHSIDAFDFSLVRCHNGELNEKCL